MVLKGVVRSGKGDFSFWLEQLEPFYRAKTGMRFFPGTLNVHLINQTYQFPADCLRLEKEEYSGRVSVSIGRCLFFGREAYILRTDTDTGKHGDPAEAILEIASDVNLRVAHSLTDGDVVEVEVPD